MTTFGDGKKEWITQPVEESCQKNRFNLFTHFPNRVMPDICGNGQDPCECHSPSTRFKFSQLTHPVDLTAQSALWPALTADLIGCTSITEVSARAQKVKP